MVTRHPKDVFFVFFFKGVREIYIISSLFAVQNKEMKRMIPQYCKENNVHFVKHFKIETKYTLPLLYCKNKSLGKEKNIHPIFKIACYLFFI